MIDFAALRTYNLPDIAQRAGVQLKANGSEYEGCCPFHSERTPSFRLYQKEGGWRYYCFGCAANGNPVDFVCEAYGVPAKEAARIIAGDAAVANIAAHPLNPPKNPYDGWRVGRPPVEASIQVGKPVRVLNLKRNKMVTYEPVSVYSYTDKHDDLLGYVLRLMIDGRKITPQVWWATDGKHECWVTMPYPSPRPLYNLGRLYEFPERQILLTEGEKCADAGQELFGDKMVSMSWMGGGKSVSRTYWKSLTGRSVVTWPDFDDEGRLSMFAVHEALKELGCKIKTVEVQAEDLPADHDPKGWDIADAAKLGKAFVTDLIRRRIRAID